MRHAQRAIPIHPDPHNLHDEVRRFVRHPDQQRIIHEVANRLHTDAPPPSDSASSLLPHPGLGPLPPERTTPLCLCDSLWVHLTSRVLVFLNRRP